MCRILHVQALHRLKELELITHAVIAHSVTLPVVCHSQCLFNQCKSYWNILSSQKWMLLRVMTTQKGSHLTFRSRRLCIINQNMMVNFWMVLYLSQLCSWTKKENKNNKKKSPKEDSWRILAKLPCLWKQVTFGHFLNGTTLMTKPTLMLLLDISLMQSHWWPSLML